MALLKDCMSELVDAVLEEIKRCRALKLCALVAAGFGACVISLLSANVVLLAIVAWKLR